MKAQVDVVCCKSVGTDLSMLDIEDFITEICQLKKEVASLEAKLRERGDKLNREVSKALHIIFTSISRFHKPNSFLITISNYKPSSGNVGKMLGMKAKRL